MSCAMIRAILFLTLLSISAGADLPAYSGPYGVGTIDVEVDVINPRNISNTTYTSTGRPVFELDTVLFSLFYPADRAVNSSNPPHPWIPRPIDLVAHGLSNYLNSSNTSVDPTVITNAITQLAGGINIPAAVDVPLSSTDENSNLTTLVFSHGDSGLRTFYSTYFGDLASRGYVVAAVEHRDGSAPGTVIMKSDGTTRNVTYTTFDQVSGPSNASELTLQQRAFRQAEIEETVKVLKNISSGGGDSVYKANSRREGQSLSGWSSRLNSTSIIIAGHSFGATTAIQVLAVVPESIIPAAGGIIFDPGKQSGPLETNISVPMLIVDSQEWLSIPTNFYGLQHFDVVKDLAQGVLNRTRAAWFITLLATSHFSITDAALLGGAFTNAFSSSGFNATIDPYKGIADYVTVSSEFLSYIQDGTRQDILDTRVTYPEFNVSDNPGLAAAPVNVTEQWRIHVSPGTAGVDDGTNSSGTSGSGNADGSGASNQGTTTIQSSLQTLFLASIVVLGVSLI